MTRTHTETTPGGRPDRGYLDRVFVRLPVTLVLVLATLAASAAAAPDDAPDAEARRTAIWEWTGVSRVVAIGDLHGSYDKLVRLLETADLVDADLAWSGDTDHLVVAGDFLDRGPGGREIMDLLRRLQDEAVAGGGRVHVLLGNHEVMNLMRDTRYVSPAAFRDFAGEETKAERRAGWRAYSVARIGEAGLADLRRDFQRSYPEGFFARQRLFEPDGEYGSWLLTLPAVVKIDGVVYVHGGLTEEFAALGVDGINRRVLDALRRHLEARAELEDAGVLSSHFSAGEIFRTAADVAERRGDRWAETASMLRESTVDKALGGTGPLWYRGSALEDERIERRVLENVLELLDAKAMVIAHTYTGGNKITSRFHGKLYRVDHGILESSRPLALVVEHGSPLVLDALEGKTLAPVRELPMGQSLLATHADLSEQQCAGLLRGGDVTHSVELGRGSSRPRLLVLERNGARARGIFKTVEASLDPATADRYQHEVAAYALDRALGLDMVPLTVVRSIDGRQGSLQSWVEGAVDREAAEAYALDVYQADSTRRQLARAEVFDSLIGNTGRRPDDVLLMINDEKVYLVDHSQAFSTSTEVLWTGADADLLAPELAGSLRRLNRATLARELGSLLETEQIDAILARRDVILDRLENGPPRVEASAAVAAD